MIVAFHCPCVFHLLQEIQLEARTAKILRYFLIMVDVAHMR
ncbi:unnamed protein product, partial [Musa hybrid cultivar]